MLALGPERRQHRGRIGATHFCSAGAAKVAEEVRAAMFSVRGRERRGGMARPGGLEERRFCLRKRVLACTTHRLLPAATEWPRGEWHELRREQLLIVKMGFNWCRAPWRYSRCLNRPDTRLGTAAEAIGVLPYAFHIAEHFLCINSIAACLERRRTR